MKKPSQRPDPSGAGTSRFHFCDVILPVPIPRTFTYSIPDELAESAVEGQRVVVPFGRKKILTGVIARVHGEQPGGYQAKDLLDVLDEIPLVNKTQIAFFEWMSSYYMAPIGDVLAAALPSGLKLSSESHIRLHPERIPGEISGLFSDDEAMLIELVEKRGVLPFREAVKLMGLKRCQKALKSLLYREAIVLHEELKDSYRPKVSVRIKLKPELLEKPGAVESLMDELDKRPKQQEVLLAYLQMVPVYIQAELNEKGLARDALLARGVSTSSLETLISKGIFQRYNQLVPRFFLPPADEGEEVLLSPVQEECRDHILSGFEENKTVLLRGITGSGKTEIYIDLAKKVLDQGGQVLYLLPEIALTTQIVERLARVFGNRMGVYHSRFSDNERVEVWRGLSLHRFGLVVGVRSAVFLPFEHLDLVIVDEEHETSYKQYDPSPRYHARDAVQMLARFHHAKVLLGSATPSVESYYMAVQGKYKLVNLVQRYGSANLPGVIFADLRKERRERSMKGEFSSLMIDRIGAALSRGEQVMIFQNRRGYSPFIQCLECAWIAKCPHCSVSLTHHMDARNLKCHYCGFTRPMPPRCDACGSARLSNIGYGTEKLEEDLSLLFPGTKIQRMDFDTTRSRHSYQKIIEGFGKGDIDILVGTQMITKGLHFDRVALVGICDIDRMLHFPDFRSAERAFQLTVQVSGRAGRSEVPGEVVVQTHNTGQKILEYIAAQDYEAFFRYELPERREYAYPPFVRLIRIHVKHRHETVAEEASTRLGLLLREALPSVNLNGPYEPLVSRIRNQYIRELLIKIPRGGQGLDSIKKTLLRSSDDLAGEPALRQAQVVFDVDPY